MGGPLFEFEPAVFAKVLAVTAGVVLVGFAGAVWLRGSVRPVDVAATLVSTVIFAYMVHLWFLPRND